MAHRNSFVELVREKVGRRGVTLAVSLVLFGALAGAPHPAGAVTPENKMLPAAAGPSDPSELRGAQAKVDANKNRVADGLDRKLRQASPSTVFRVIVMMEKDKGVAQAKAVAGDFTVRRSFTIINGFAATMTGAQVEALSRSSSVLRIEEDSNVQAFLSDAKAAFGIDRLHDVPGVSPPMELGAAIKGSGTGICVIDTGIDANHTDLSGKVQGFCDATTGGCGASDPGLTTPYDDHYHGTHVSSIAAGKMGVAPSAVLFGAKVLDSTGQGPVSQIVAGIEYCAAQSDVDVLNLSLGSVGSGDGTDAMSVAANAAVNDHNKVVVVAAGNNGPGRYEIGPLAAAQDVITVAAVTEWLSNAGGWRKGLAVFTSRGPTSDGRVKPDISAPGVDIEAASANTGSGVRVLSGTSMASPFIAGVAALIREADPSLSPAQVKNILAQTAVRRGDQSTKVPPGSGWPKNNDFGWGLANPYAAVALALGQSSYTPTPYPSQIYVKDSVADFTVWEHTFAVTDPNTDVSVNVFNGGPWRCATYLFGICFISDPGADFDAALYDPDGVLVDMSTCEVDADTQCGASGRQETLLANSAGGPLKTGNWTVRVTPWNGDAYDNKPAEDVDVIITMGPVGSSTAPANQTPIADAGAAQTVTDSDGNGNQDVTLDGSGSSDPDGTLVSYSWSEGGVGIGTGVSPKVNFTVGVHSVTLTVVDNGGASASDTVVITVNAAPASTPPLDATFTWDPPAIVDQTVHLSATVQENASYAWSIAWPGGPKNDPNLVPNDADASFTPKKTGDYTVTLTVSRDGEASVSTTQTIAVGSGDGSGGTGGGKSCNPNSPKCTGG